MTRTVIIDGDDPIELRTLEVSGCETEEEIREEVKKVWGDVTILQII